MVADRCAVCVRAMAKTVAGLGGIDATNANVIAGVDGIVPVKIVIAVDPIPSAVMRLQGVMRPANAGIRARHDDSFSSEPKRPDIRRVRVSDARLDGRRSAGYARLQWRFFYGAGLREIIVNVRVACHARDVWASSQCFGELPIAFYQNRVHKVERAIFDLAIAQPLQDWLLRSLRLVQQGLIHESALFCLGGQSTSTAQVG